MKKRKNPFADPKRVKRLTQAAIELRKLERSTGSRRCKQLAKTLDGIASHYRRYV